MDIVETIGSEILDALKKDAGGWGYVGEGDELSATVLDGHFDLTKVTRAAVRATLRYYMENVSDGMMVYADAAYLDSRYEDQADGMREYYKAMLTQALAEIDA